MRKFVDERYPDDVITEEQLRNEWEGLSSLGLTDSYSFEEYLVNCTDKNGTLTEIREAI